MHYISSDNLIKLLKNLRSDYQVYVPIKEGDQRLYKKFDGSSQNIIVGEVRPVEPLKVFFSRAREVVAEDFKEEIPHSGDKPYCVVGVKNCDLKGFRIQDYVFNNNDCEDPLYIRNREKNLIIGADCTCAIDTCFCLSLGNQPYPEKDFDINLSEVEGGYVVAVGSEKGDDLIKKNSHLFEQAHTTALKVKDEQRAKVVKEVEGNIAEYNIPSHTQYNDIIEKNFESDIWEDEAKTCVECGACTIICPGCHCFLLYDQKDKEKMARFKIWDSCMLKDYARVAGGANPRAKLYMRLRNRFYKKFDFFPKVADIFGCSGCGRCITACPAKIDIRKVLKRLVSNV